MRKAFIFIEHGSTMEFHVAYKPKKGDRNWKSGRRDGQEVLFWGKKNTTKAQQLQLGIPALQFNWMDVENLKMFNLRPEDMLHLRPDVILKSLPEGTEMLVALIASGLEYSFVVGMPKPEENRWLSSTSTGKHLRVVQS